MLLLSELSVGEDLLSMQSFACPIANAPVSDVLRGRELEVVAWKSSHELTATANRSKAERSEAERYCRPHAQRTLPGGRRHGCEPGVESGFGKTAFLERTLTLLQPHHRVSALVGDLATENDALRLARSQRP